MKKYLLRLVMALSLLIWSASSFSQTKQKSDLVVAPQPVFRVVHLYNVSPEAVAQALIPFTKYNLAIVSPSAELRSITISGSEETVNAMESMISELDVPPPEPTEPAIFEITIDFLYLTSDASQKPDDQLETFPNRLYAVVKELSYNFHYRNYQLMDSIVLLNTEQQGGSSSGSTGISGVPVEYRIAFAKSSLIGDKNKTVRLSDLKMSLKYQFYAKDDAQSGKGHTENRESNFTTNLDVRPGQQMVFGKSGFMGNAIVAVISVKIVR
jgi:type II secretory pathway component GspD/PulD (secretin)